MPKWGNVDFKQFENLKKRLEQFEKVDRQAFIISSIKELAARLLRKVIHRTPRLAEKYWTVGYKGGTLIRGWTASKNQAAQAFVSSLNVKRTGDSYEITIVNPVNYASYVEFGHRTRNHKGWVEGKFMLTISEAELDQQKDKILEKKIEKWLEEVFNG